MTATPSQETSSCERCGTSLVDGARFCSSCGSSTVGEDRLERPKLVSEGSHLIERLERVTAGEFDVIRELGRGGMATVFLAHDLSLDRKVAIKVMAPDLAATPGMAERFKREARTAAGLSHPHIIPIYSVREIDDLLFFVMKYVEGRPLDVIIAAGGPLPLDVVRAIVTEVAGALAVAHRKNVVHRDIKPGNILIDEDGWAVVTDFGIAKVAQRAALTATGGTIGTPTYMSPEQCVGGEITGASDQYSLGILAYQMLVGGLPFDAETVMSSMWAHVNEPPEPIHDLRPECPAPIASAIMRMLEKDPANRWSSMAEIAEVFTSAHDGQDDPPAREEMRALATGEIDRSAVLASPESPVPPTRPERPDPTVVLQTMDEDVAVLTVSPPAGKITVGRSLQIVATPKAADGTQLVGRSIGWTSSVPDVAQVSAEGLVTGLSEGTATITAASEGKMDICSIAVLPKPVDHVRVEPARTRIQMMGSVQLGLALLDEKGAHVKQRHVTWMSSDASVAQVSPAGAVRGIRPGNVLIAATVDGKRGVAAITVTPIPLAAVILSPRESVIGVDEQLQLHANPVDERGMTLPERKISWLSSDQEILTVSARGMVTGRQVGVATVDARCEDKVVTATVTVKKIPLAHLVVDQKGGAMVIEQRLQMRAHPQDASGRELTDRAVTWESSHPDVLQVTPDGAATAQRAGSAVLTARCEDKEATVTVMVSRVGVSRVELSSPARKLEVGDDVVLKGETYDRFGEPLRKRFIQWASSNPEVATVSPSGRVVAVSPGTAQITAASGSNSASVEVAVTPPAVARLKIQPDGCSIPEGWQQQFGAVVLSTTGEVISEVKCEWSVSDPSVASISSAGVVTTHRPGSVMIAANGNGKRATARVIVTRV